MQLRLEKLNFAAGIDGFVFEEDWTLFLALGLFILRGQRNCYEFIVNAGAYTQIMCQLIYVTSYVLYRVYFVKE